MSRRQNFLLHFLFAAAIMLALYPFMAGVYNGLRQQQLVVGYEETVEALEEEADTAYLEAAQAWNESLYISVKSDDSSEDIGDPEIYESLLNVNGDGMMGHIVIPKINVNLPIYHDTTEDVLLRGAGHLASSALPVGGTSTHCVITAHRGLPTAEMFTNLDRMETGDIFYLKVLGETYAYEVIGIQEVSPEETTSLLPVAGEDLCTLVTCTPYGINSMRLLVTGTRTEYIEGEDEMTQSVVRSAVTDNRCLLLAAALEIGLFIYIKKKQKPSMPPAPCRRRHI